MKNIYLLTIIFLSAFNLNAQLTLTKAGYEPTIGDLDKRISYDSSTVVSKNTGANQVWNFTSLITTTATGSYTTAFVNTASAPNATLFPGATIASYELGGNSYQFYKSSSSIYEFLGHSDLTAPETMVFSIPATLRSWPISYGSSSTDSWAALQTSSSGTMSMVGNVTVSASGSGTVILPNGNVHTNCIQVVETITMTVTSGTFTSPGHMIHYFYYSSLSKFPIMEIDYEVFPSSPIKFFATVNSDAMVAGVIENADNSIRMSVYPNPAENTIHFTIPSGDALQSVEVTDLQGKSLIHSEVSDSLDISSLNQGVYAVKLNFKNSSCYFKVIKSH